MQGHLAPPKACDLTAKPLVRPKATNHHGWEEFRRRLCSIPCKCSARMAERPDPDSQRKPIHWLALPRDKGLVRGSPPGPYRVAPPTPMPETNPLDWGGNVLIRRPFPTTEPKLLWCPTEPIPPIQDRRKSGFEDLWKKLLRRSCEKPPKIHDSNRC
jgi:hypothetical protein